MNLYPIDEVTFDEENHQYFFRGTELFGVTSLISERLGKNFPRDSARVQLLCSYGSQVHKEVEEWIKEGKEPSSAKAKWVISRLPQKSDLIRFGAEVTVSDFEATASNIDIVQYEIDNTVILYDIKTGNFDREYCTLQLNAYKVLFEYCFPQYKVKALKVLCTKTETLFPVAIRPAEDSWKLIEKNKYKC